MAMVVSHNSSAQMALGELRKNNNKLDNASRQAASGVKIGGAGDGASEYAISEKMRVQIRGLEQDIANAQTGTNLIKTAEGGIQEIINNLRSLKELALNAANDHNTDLDRETIQKEVDSRLATIDDIAATTNYNGRLLLNGDYYEPLTSRGQSPTPGSEGSGGVDGGNSVTGLGLFRGLPTMTMRKTGAASWADGLPAYLVARPNTPVRLDFTGTTASSVADLDQKGFVLLCTLTDCPAYCGFVFDASMPAGTGTKTGGTEAADADRPTYTVGIGGVNSFAELAKALFDGVQAIEGGSGIRIELPTGHSPTFLRIGNNYTMSYDFELFIYEGKAGESVTPSPQPPPEQPTPTPYETYDPGKPLIIHTGTKANQHLRVFIHSMDTETLGIQPLPVSPREVAAASLDLIDQAIDYSLNENTRMGAYQTELSYTIANLITASENTQASESVIRDADMAKAMMEHAKYNILSQSAQSILAQANQNSSSVLSLLQ